MSGKPSSTIGFEKRCNPLLSLDVDAFVNATSEIPPKPPEMSDVTSFNQGSNR